MKELVTNIEAQLLHRISVLERANSEIAEIAAGFKRRLDMIEARHSDGALDVLAERKRQIEIECYDDAHDDAHVERELAFAALAYLRHYCLRAAEGKFYAALGACAWWPFAQHFWKPKGPRRDLVTAGALVIAEIERLDRATARGAKV